MSAKMSVGRNVGRSKVVLGRSVVNGKICVFYRDPEDLQMMFVGGSRNCRMYVHQYEQEVVSSSCDAMLCCMLAAHFIDQSTLANCTYLTVLGQNFDSLFDHEEFQPIKSQVRMQYQAANWSVDAYQIFHTPAMCMLLSKLCYKARQTFEARFVANMTPTTSGIVTGGGGIPGLPQQLSPLELSLLRSLDTGMGANCPYNVLPALLPLDATAPGTSTPRVRVKRPATCSASGYGSEYSSGSSASGSSASGSSASGSSASGSSSSGLASSGSSSSSTPDMPSSSTGSVPTEMERADIGYYSQGHWIPANNDWSASSELNDDGDVTLTPTSVFDRVADDAKLRARVARMEAEACSTAVAKILSNLKDRPMDTPVPSKRRAPLSPLFIDTGVQQSPIITRRAAKALHVGLLAKVEAGTQVDYVPPLTHPYATGRMADTLVVTQLDRQSVFKGGDNSHLGDCMICYCPMDDPAHGSGCRHLFCFACLRRSCQEKVGHRYNNICPFCRADHEGIIHGLDMRDGRIIGEFQNTNLPRRCTT